MGKSPNIANEFLNNFAVFQRRFPTIESRHDAARELAVTDPVDEVDKDYTSRYLLAAHWGDEDAVLKQTAYALYLLKKRIDRHGPDQPVVVIKSGALTDVWSSSGGGSEDRLEKDVELQYGFLARNELVHGFSGNITDRGPKRMGIEPPYIGFGTLLPVRDSATVHVDVLGETEVTPTDSSDEVAVPVYFGAVPLEFNRDVYRISRQTTRRAVLLGSEAVSMLVQLTQKTDNSAPLQALSELAQSA